MEQNRLHYNVPAITNAMMKVDPKHMSQKYPTYS